MSKKSKSLLFVIWYSSEFFRISIIVVTVIHVMGHWALLMIHTMVMASRVLSHCAQDIPPQTIESICTNASKHLSLQCRLCRVGLV